MPAHVMRQDVKLLKWIKKKIDNRQLKCYYTRVVK